ncbi:MAG: sulfatase-like hydrolase/transferase, partial [Pseudomonadota bacterium]|nr:sulfatase-like hydrolase/transferase [Pseudomonadota bacterium]
SFLLSNSGKSGSWNIATSVIFKSSSSQVFSSNIPAIGNWDLKDKPYDSEFFNNKVTSILTNNEQPVLFLHSYAGHGPYLELIPPEFKHKVDDFFSGFEKKAIFGDLVINERNDLPMGRINLKQRSVLDNLLENVEGHDSAIRYIDHSISKIINEIKQLSDPVIFMYFSDHGESVFSGRAHDSVLFSHEMLRIPFIIYFNESARNQMPLVFEKYSKLAASNNVATLSQLSSTIMDLLGLNLSQHINNKNISFTKVIGEDVILSPIFSRRKRDGVEFINLNDSNLEQYFTSETYRTNEDAATKIFKASAFNQSKTRVCYQRSNTIAKLLRGKLVADCLEIDVVVDSNGSIDIYHPPAENTSLKLDFILSDVFGGEHALWIDAKNIHEAENCNILYESLKRYGKFKHEVLVEFPSDAINVLSTLKSCALDLNNIGIFTSYYIDTNMGLNCSRKLNDGQELSSIPACSELRDQLIEVNKSGIFTDISFDYAGLIAVKSVLKSDKLRWNTWHVEAGDFSKTIHDRFRMVILRNNGDPNDKL